MRPKVEAASDFVRKTKGVAVIGALEDALALLHGTAGTTITMDVAGIEWAETAGPPPLMRWYKQ